MPYAGLIDLRAQLDLQTMVAVAPLMIIKDVDYRHFPRQLGGDFGMLVPDVVAAGHDD